MNAELLTSTFEKMRTSLKTMAIKIVGKDDDADDVLQNAFVKLWSVKDQRARNINNIEGYIANTVRNSSIDMMKRSKDTIALDTIPNVHIDPNLNEATEELFDEIMKIIRSNLPPLQMEILTLRYVKQLEFKDISQRLEIPEVTVRVYLSRAKTTIRNIHKKRNGYR